MKRLVLVGGGHAHLHVLSQLATSPIRGWQVDLVSPHPQQIYSGMLPGWIAGHHPLHAAMVPLAPLAERAGIALHQTAGTLLDLQRTTLDCADGASLGFDALSLDVGPDPALGGLVVDSADVIPIRPLAGLVDAWPRLMARIGSARRPFHLVVVGGGAGGLELAFAVRQRAVREAWPHLKVTLVGTDALPLDGAPESARRRAMASMAERRIDWRGRSHVKRIEANRLVFGGQDSLGFDACWLATGAAAPQWLQGSGLKLDQQGFVLVSDTLQSIDHPHVFAAGDAAAMSPPAGPLPKSGVYAVRAGAPLAHNLRAFCTGQPLRSWKPQSRALYLLSTGDRHAIGIWGRWSWQGKWVWRWKARIDQGFVSTYTC